ILDGIETKDYTSDGDLFSIWGAKLVPDRPHPSGWERCLPSEKRSKPAGQWNHYRVECNDGVIKLAVNGKVVSGGSKARPRKGYLCLEAEGSECHFRNLRIKELPSTKPRPEEVAEEARGFVTLFNGLDLTGLEVDKELRKDCKVDPGANKIVFKRGGWLGLGGIPRNFELIFDCRVLAKATNVVVTGKAKADRKFPHYMVPLADFLQTRRWARVVVKRSGGKLSVT